MPFLDYDGLQRFKQKMDESHSTNPVVTGSISMGRKANTTVGTNSVAVGYNVTASNINTHAEGSSTVASGQNSHVEGVSSTASGSYSHAEGYSTQASSSASHAEGTRSIASGYCSHAEGEQSTASAYYSHAEGSHTVASKNGSHAEGYGSQASGNYSHAEGYYTVANHLNQHVFGTYNVPDPSTSSSSANGNYVEIVGNGTSAGQSNARTLDWNGNERLRGSLYINANADGTGGTEVATKTDTVLDTTLSRGRKSSSDVGSGSFAFGNETVASGDYSHAEGSYTTASALYAHAEGMSSEASAQASHAEGFKTKATGSFSHSEGGSSTASGVYSHAEGSATVASGSYSHAEGQNTEASGSMSHAEGEYTVANHSDQHVFGTYNVPDPSAEISMNHGNYIEIVGNGTSEAQSNARTLDWNGNERLLGKLYVNANTDGTGGTEVAVIANNAGAHNSIYRGKFLGTSVTPAQYSSISNGTFEDLYVGDYWTIGGHDWVICDFDYYIGTGNLYSPGHHLVMMPRGCMNIPAGTELNGKDGELMLLGQETDTTKAWSAENSTNGGYKYSRMRTVIMRAADTIVLNAFGSNHVVSTEELYPNPSSDSDSGLASNWQWFSSGDSTSANRLSICDLCNETMVYGQQIWGCGSSYKNVGYEIGIDKYQLAIFGLHREFANIGQSWWLRSVSSTTQAACVSNHGSADQNTSSQDCGVRPRFILK